VMPMIMVQGDNPDASGATPKELCAFH